MITFIVPVKSKKVSGSWEHFSRLFERTLKSIGNQTSPEYRIVVVCHEKPLTNYHNTKVEFVEVDFAPPLLTQGSKEKNNELKEEDKSKKILAGLEHIKKYQQDYVMVADADDCISNKIAAFVEEHKNEGLPGWYFKKGYIYREGSKFIYLNRENFNAICGTGIIVKPSLIKHVFTHESHLHYAHETIKLTENDALRPFPLPGSIYSMANGENHYMTGGQLMDRIVPRRLLSFSAINALLRKIYNNRPSILNRSIKNEFGIYNIEQ